MCATTAVHDNTDQSAGTAPPARGYQYKHGDRPLEGYTIQRGAGRGGFGEVYYAVSDSGREVALKVVHTYEQIEIRGISQCMNLKSPHLVTVFDVRYGDDGRPWVIMEYVGGPSLRQLIDASPAGLGTQKAAFFLREIAKGLTYLHDCGIVHRDLKPGNIFYENGYVKIGDYGLSKAISTSRHSGQTVTVGTVHYMAPEIGAGNYDRGIDIYALGALLFEMLTGQVPFFGASTAEVLMKHLNTAVDTSAIEEPFRTVIQKAMAKNPADRYQSVQEMVEAIFGAEHVRNSVSAFAPESLTMVAGYAAQKMSPAGVGSGSFTPSDGPAPDPCWQQDRWGRMAGVMDRVGDRVGRKVNRLSARVERKLGGGLRGPSAEFADPFNSVVGDPLRLWHRLVLAGIVVCIVAMAGGLVNERAGGESAFVALMGTAWATGMAMIAWYFVAPALRHESPWITRLAVGGPAGFGTILFSLPFWDQRHMGHTALAIFVGFLVMDWRQRLSSLRPERIEIGRLVTAAILGLALGSVLGGWPPLAMTVLVGTTLTCGIAAPWTRRKPAGAIAGAPRTGAVPPPIPTPAANYAPMQAAPAVAPPIPQPAALSPLTPPPPPPLRLRPVPRIARGVWLTFFVGFATLGLFMLLMLLNVHAHDDERALMFGFGTGAMLFAAFCLRRGRRTLYSGVWEYVFRPVIQLMCMQAILVSASFLMLGRMHDNDMPPAIFFIVFPSIVLFVLTFFTGRGGHMTTQSLPAPIPAPVREASDYEPITLGGVVLGFGRFVFHLVGSVVLTFSLLAALAVASNLPGLFQSGVLDPRMPQDLEQAFGTPNWPRIMLHIGAAISFVSAMIASGLLLLPRRHRGAAYMFRAIVGIGVLFASMMVLGRALPDWGYVSPGSTPGVVLDNYLQSVRTPGLFLGGLMCMFGIFILLWPAARRQPAAQITYTPAPIP